MSMYSSSLYLHECKTQASRLLKAVLSPKKEIQLQAYHRMQILPEFKGKTLADIVEMIQLKHALKLIAKEKKFNSWLDLKTHIVKSNPEDFINLIFNGFLNKWFSSYNQAKEEHFKNKGYLFPYRNQFFICEPPYIARMGLDPFDDDWEKLGFDWVNPLEIEAKIRLYKKLLKIQGGYHV